jgi:parallel beta-helix repeat protein
MDRNCCFRLASALVVLFLLAAVTESQGADNEQALKQITDAAERLCGTVATTGSANTLKVKGDIRAELNGLVKKLADLGVKGAGEIETTSYEGVVQQELTTALRDVRECKLKVFQLLEDKLILRNPASVPQRSPAGIRIENSTGVTVQGNVVEGYPTGIDVTGSSNVTGSDNIVRQQASGSFPPPTGEFRSLSNAQLRRQVQLLGNSMRSFQKMYDERDNRLLASNLSFEERVRAIESLHAEETDLFLRQFAPQAASLVSEILSRTGPIQASITEGPKLHLGVTVLREKVLVGPHPVSAAADFLEFLSRRLSS